MKKTALISFVFFLTTISFSQHNAVNLCSHNESVYKELKTNPELQVTLDSIQNIQKQVEMSYKNSVTRSGTIYYIPIVFHVIHQGGPENISDAQINSTMVELNNLYRKRNSNVTAVVSAFTSIVGDMEIEFRLAQKKDNGTCFSGITRTFSSTTNGGGVPAMNAVITAHGNFPGNKYLNVFISKNIGGAAGYTYYPGYPYNASMKNGIHILHTYVGKIGTSTQTGVNTTLAHEVGHWLNLPHLWGSSNTPGSTSNCTIDDGVSDTPITVGWRSCNLSGTSCGSLDNVENIMEYSYCSKMFTNGQKTRMRAALNSTIAGRNNLITATNHVATGIFSDIICEADFSVKNKIVCQYDTIQFMDNSFHNPTSWSWSFPGGTPSTSTLQNPKVVYNSTGKKTVSFTASNSSGLQLVTKNQFVKILPSVGNAIPFHEGFESGLATNDWETEITPSSLDWSITSSASYTGSKCLKLENFGNQNGTESVLLSSSFDLTGSSTVTLSYKYAYTRTNSTQGEIIQFLVSNDCGENWVIFRGLLPTTSTTNADFTPSGQGQWKTHTFNLNPIYFTSNFRFKFRIKNGNGNNIYIDDINLDRNLGVEELKSLNSLIIYPNPMADESEIAIDLRKNAKVTIKLLNVFGQTVSVILDNKNRQVGNSLFQIKRNKLSSGIYFVKITMNEEIVLKKIVLK